MCSGSPYRCAYMSPIVTRRVASASDNANHGRGSRSWRVPSDVAEADFARHDARAHRDGHRSQLEHGVRIHRCCDSDLENRVSKALGVDGVVAADHRDRHSRECRISSSDRRRCRQAWRPRSRRRSPGAPSRAPAAAARRTASASFLQPTASALQTVLESQAATSDIAAARATNEANVVRALITASTLAGYCCHHGSNADERSREECDPGAGLR